MIFAAHDAPNCPLWCCAACGSAVRPSPLLKGGEQTFIQNVFLRLPSVIPLWRRDEGETCLPTNKTRLSHAKARSTFVKNNLFACPAFTGYVAASDARRTQPLLKLPGLLDVPAGYTTDNYQHGQLHTSRRTHNNLYYDTQGLQLKRGNVREPNSARLKWCSCASGQDGALSFPAPVIILTSETNPSI